MCNHKKNEKNTHAYTGTAIIIYKHDAHRLVQHMLQVVEVAWTDDSHLLLHAPPYVTFEPPGEVGEGLVQLLHHQTTRWTRS